jgi:hypothetical protein
MDERNPNFHTWTSPNHWLTEVRRVVKGVLVCTMPLQQTNKQTNKQTCGILSHVMSRVRPRWCLQSHVHPARSCSIDCNGFRPTLCTHSVGIIAGIYPTECLSSVRHKTAVTEWQMTCWLQNISPTCFQLETFIQIWLHHLLFSSFSSLPYWCFSKWLAPENFCNLNIYLI